jgi:ribosomal protein S13
MKEYRDQTLGGLLSQIDETPPPAPGFDEGVWRRIDTQAAAPATAQWSLASCQRRRLLVVAVAVVAAAAVAVALFGVPGAGRRTGPAVVSAAEVSARMKAAMSSYRTLQATMTTTRAGRSERSTFIQDARGDYTVRHDLSTYPQSGAAGAVPLSETYNARRHVEIDTYVVEPNGHTTSYKWSQAPPSEGRAGATSPGCAWLVRAALAEGDPSVTVTDTSLDGRAAWRVVLPRDKRFGYLAGMSFVVDQQSGFLVQWTWPPTPNQPIPDSGGTATLSDLRVDGPLPTGAFSVAVPPDAKLVSLERNRYYCTLKQVPSRVGFRPFVPSYLPSGYRLSDVATDPRTVFDFLGWNGPDPGTHDPHTEEFLSYRHGADRFTVHVVSIAGYPRRQVMHTLRTLITYPAYRDMRLHSGVFARRAALTWFDYNGANLIVAGRTYVAYISGSLTRQDLHKVAGSLRQ